MMSFINDLAKAILVILRYFTYFLAGVMIVAVLLYLITWIFEWLF